MKLGIFNTISAKLGTLNIKAFLGNNEVMVGTTFLKVTTPDYLNDSIQTEYMAAGSNFAIYYTITDTYGGGGNYTVIPSHGTTSQTNQSYSGGGISSSFTYLAPPTAVGDANITIDITNGVGSTYKKIINLYIY